MKKLLLNLILIIICITSFSQTVKFDWVSQIGGTGNDEGYIVETDKFGNMYTAGYYEDTIDVDPSITINNHISKGSTDIIIQKFNPFGDLIWAFSFGGSDFDVARDIKVDANGDVLITGFFSDTIDFDPGISTTKLISILSYDIFILKLRSNGNFVWANSFGANSIDIGCSVDTDLNGNVLVTGTFSGTVDFDPDTSVYNLVSTGGDNIFILKLDSSGGFIWANGIGGNNYDEGRVIKTDVYGNIYTTGYFNGTIDFDPGLGTSYLPYNGRRDVFILKLNPNGSFLWVKGVGGSNNDRSYSLILDSKSNVYTTGYYNGTVDFDTDTGSYYLTSNGSNDIFIQKLDSAGNFVWAKSMGSSGDDQGFAISIDSKDNIYTSGYFENTVNFNTDSTGLLNLTSNGDRDIFIQKLDKDGNFIWANSFGGTNWDQTRSIYVDQSDKIYATGYFRSSVDFDPDSLTSQNLTSNGLRDIFILKLNQCFHSFDTIITSSCSSYTSPSGKFWTQSGTYLDTIQNNTGCDSILSINLTIINIDTSLTKVNHIKISSNDTLASYQWIECTNGPISGDTNRSFIATANGNYAVILTNNGCIDTSACVSILSVGVVESAPESSSIRFFPNPNNGIFTLEMDKIVTNKTFQIYDASGRLVKEAHVTSKKTRIDLSQFGRGVYFIINREFGISEKVVVY